MPRYARRTRKISPLTIPLTLEQIRAQAKRGGIVKGIVLIDITEIIESSYNLGEEGFLDLLSRRLIGTDLLSDFTYKIVGVKNDMLLIQVKGDARLHIESVAKE